MITIMDGERLAGCQYAKDVFQFPKIDVCPLQAAHILTETFRRFEGVSPQSFKMSCIISSTEE